MGRNHSKAVTSRRSPGTRKVNNVILYCEGRNTEPNYFDLLKKNNCKVVPVIVRGHGIGSCLDFVEEANKKYKIPVDKTLEIAQNLYEKKYITYPRARIKPRIILNRYLRWLRFVLHNCSLRKKV